MFKPRRLSPQCASACLADTTLQEPPILANLTPNPHLTTFVLSIVDHYVLVETFWAHYLILVKSWNLTNNRCQCKICALAFVSPTHHIFSLCLCHSSLFPSLTTLVTQIYSEAYPSASLCSLTQSSHPHLLSYLTELATNESLRLSTSWSTRSVSGPWQWSRRSCYYGSTP